MADKALYNLLIDLRANTAQLQQDMDRAVGVLQRATGKMASVTRGFFEGLGQGISREFIGALKDLPGLLNRLADAGEEAGSIADSFKQLGGASSSIEQARKATLGMVSSFDLMKIANEGMLRGIPKLNENFGMLADFAGRFANATGRDTVEVLQGITDAVGKGSAKALKDFGIVIEDTGSKTGNAAAAIEAFRAKMAEMGPVTDSVSNAHKAFAVAMDDAWKQIGIGVNENEELARVYRELEEAVNSIDWRQVGSDVASMAASVASVLPSLKTVAAEIHNIALGLRWLTGNLTPAEQKLEKIRQLQIELEKAEQASKNDFASWLTDGSAAKRAEELRRQIDQTKRSLQSLKNADDMDSFMAGAVAAGAGAAGTPSHFGGDTPRVSSAKKVNKELADDRARQELKALMEADRERSQQAGALLRAQYEVQREAQEQAVAGWESAIHGVFSGLNLDPAIASSAATFGSQIAAGLFSDLKENQGGFFGLGQTIAEGLGEGLAYITSQFSGSSSGSSGSSGGSWISGLFGGSSMAGDGMTTDQAHASGIQGPGAKDGSFNGQQQGQNWGAWAQFGTMMHDLRMNTTDRDRNQTDNRAYGETTGAAIGGIIAGIFSFGIAAPLGAAIGGAFGKEVGKLFGRGSQNPETQQRHAFANWVEDRFEEMGGFDVRRAGGGFTRMTNFIEGDKSRFNDPNWGAELQKQSKQVQSTFSGLGFAFKELLGITEDVGDQIGFLFGENMAFDIDNARHFVKRLGLSFEEVEEKLVAIGLKGEKTWLEIETGLQGASEAFKPGLVAVGAYGQAMDNLLNSGARGFTAVESVRDLFVEAAEAGITNFEQLREQLLKTFDPETVNAFFAAVNQRGVASIEAGMKLDDRTAGGLVADMQAAGVKFKEVGDQISQATSAVDGSIREATGSIRSLTSAIQNLPGVQYSPPASSEGEEAFASGGVVTGPTRALMGEAGPEAILPLTRRNGRLGVSLHGVSGGGGGYVVNIDARGAAPGVEHRIRQAIRESEDRVTRGIFRSISSSHRRGT